MIRRVFLTLCCVALFLPTLAQERTWTKYHRQVLLGEEVLGEYTVIVTSDGLDPMHVRYLYRSQEGVLLVMRHELGEELVPPQLWSSKW